MILLLPGNAKRISKYVRYEPAHFGQLLTPRRTMTKAGLKFGHIYGIDNECYALGDKFNPGRYLRALWRIAAVHPVEYCWFAAAPDVVCDARATLDRFGPWSVVIREIGFPVALVAQDGLENLVVPWGKLDTLFVDGSTEWKMSESAAYLMLEAKQCGKRVHVGRVNSFTRIDQLKVKPDSIDGTHLTKRPDIYAKRWQSQLDARNFNLKFEFMKSIPQWGMGLTNDHSN